MATSRDTVQLLIEILGEEGLQRLARATEQAAEQARRAAAGYEVLDTVVAKSGAFVGNYSIATDKVNVALDEQVRKAVEATQAQKAMATIVEEATAKTTALAGQGGKGGFGLMGASYAAQDFITVLAGGGGLGRALMSTANNITPMLMGLGVGAGLAGALGTVTTVASAGTMAIEGWWKAADSDKAEEAKDKYKALAEDLKRVNREFDRLGGNGEAEKLSAEGFKLFFEGKGNKENAQKSIAPFLSSKEATARMGEGDRQQFADLEGMATMSDNDVLARAQSSIGESLNPADLRAAIEDVERDRENAQRTRERLLQQARQAAAKHLIVTSTEAGPEGKAARARLAEMSSFTPGLGELGGMTPEAIEAANKEYEEGLPEFEKIEASGKALSRGLKKSAADRRAEVEEEATTINAEREREDAAHESAKSARKRAEAGRKRDARQAAAERRAAERDAKRSHKDDIESQAGTLVANLPEIAGHAMGPQAAMAASRANPAEIREMAEQTARALEAGAMPYDAVLEAFRRVNEAAQRNAMAARSFQTRLQNSMTTGLPR